MEVVAAVNDLWKNSLPIVVDICRPSFLVEQWTLMLNWREGCDKGGMQGLEAHLASLDQFLREYAVDIAAGGHEFRCVVSQRSHAYRGLGLTGGSRNSVGACGRADTEFPASADVVEHFFPVVQTPMGELLVSVTHCHKEDKSCAHGLVSARAPEGEALGVREVDVRMDTHTSNVVRGHGRESMSPTRSPNSLAVGSSSQPPVWSTVSRLGGMCMSIRVCAILRTDGRIAVYAGSCEQATVRG